MAKESSIVKRITDWLDTLGPGCKWLKIHGSIYQERGTPDLLVVYHGTPYLWECKTERGKTTKLQAHKMKAWHLAGANTSVIRSLSDAQRALGVVDCQQDKKGSP